MHASPAPTPTKVRVVVFGSFYRGYYVLHELLNGELSQRVEVVGVATDDATQAFVSPGKRVWQYPHTPGERTMVQSLAVSHGIEVHSGRVKTAEFYALMQNRWKPDLCIMATFGQKISSELFEAPKLGFYNLHPCIDDAWPSQYVGGNPFQALLDTHKKYTVIAMHRVDNGFDTGELIAYSERVPIPPHVGVVDLHKITSPSAGRLAATQIGKIIDSVRPRLEP
jgi:methionyl-tRNA formyltransferase